MKLRGKFGGGKLTGVQAEVLQLQVKAPQKLGKLERLVIV